MRSITLVFLVLAENLPFIDSIERKLQEDLQLILIPIKEKK
jgi:hypothetical protein